jgi:cysteinyl-tRNA synthetase
MKHHYRHSVFFILAFLIGLITACDIGPSAEEEEQPPSATPSPAIIEPDQTAPPQMTSVAPTTTLSPVPTSIAGHGFDVAHPPVTSFLYQLQNIDLDAVGQTSYDLVVMDYSAEGDDETAFTAGQIAALQHSPGGEKIVLAYMSIGEAENYRFYWNRGWDADGDGDPDAGAPTWLDVENPDWEGNYKVRYWDSGWQAIIYGSPHSYLDKIITAGFDGVYLDIIDAYWYYEEQDRDSAAREMVDFVIRLADYARARQPGFLIFPQNAAELAADFPDYVVAVDGIGQEDIYYGYEEDDQPTPPAVTAELEGYLDIFKSANKLVLTIDYATTPAHVDDAYTKSHAKGYVPFVTVRDLDQLIINPGHEPETSLPASALAYETRPDGAIRLSDPPPGASDQKPAFSPERVPQSQHRAPGYPSYTPGSPAVHRVGHS